MISNSRPPGWSVSIGLRKGGRMSGSFQYGVSTCSYVDDYGSVMTLEDVFDHIADTGATGIEILGEGQIEGYPNPTSQFLDR